jgi:hypothetical protein
MTRIQAAVTKSGTAEFVVLAVKPSAIGNPTRREELQRLGERLFRRRTALLGEDGRSWGPPDIVRWLQGVPVDSLPWREYTVS